MISTLSCTEKEQVEILRNTLKRLAARMTEDRWNMQFCSTAKEANGYLQSRPVVDLVCCDVTQEDMLEWLEQFRKVYKQTKVMLIADEGQPPMRYLRPQIMASSLLLKPYSQGQLQEILTEFIRAYLEEEPDESKCFVFKSKEGKLIIPYEQIYYLEAREKKLFVRTLGEEYAFYETMDKIITALPEYFIRTHRSFVVNGRLVERIRLSDNLVTLRDGFLVPLSRSYKADMKEFVK